MDFSCVMRINSECEPFFLSLLNSLSSKHLFKRCQSIVSLYYVLNICVDQPHLLFYFGNEYRRKWALVVLFKVFLIYCTAFVGYHTFLNGYFYLINYTGGGWLLNSKIPKYLALICRKRPLSMLLILLLLLLRLILLSRLILLLLLLYTYKIILKPYCNHWVNPSIWFDASKHSFYWWNNIYFQSNISQINDHFNYLILVIINREL